MVPDAGRAHDVAQRVRRTHESRRNRCGGNQRCHDEYVAHRAVDVDAKAGRRRPRRARGCRFAVQGERARAAGGDIDEENPDLHPGGVGHGAHHPPERIPHGVGFSVCQHHHDRRVGECSDDDSGHEQHADRRANRRRERRRTQRPPRRAPANAASGTIDAPSPSVVAITAPTAAPPETPRRYGSASGLRMVP